MADAWLALLPALVGSTLAAAPTDETPAQAQEATTATAATAAAAAAAEQEEQGEEEQMYLGERNADWVQTRRRPAFFHT